MILKQGHKYEPMPHDGKLIAYIYRGGRCYYYDSPYSLAATQALKAAFPQYWTAIRNYGVTHPQLVPFVNEDPMLIVSLVEVGKTRWLVGDGKAYIKTDIWGTKNMTTEVTACNAIWRSEQEAFTSNDGSKDGSASQASYCGYIALRYNNTIQGLTPTHYIRQIFTDYNSTHTYKTDKDNLYIDGVSVGTKSAVTYGSGGWLQVFKSSTFNALQCYISKVIFTTDSEHTLLPFIRNGENGMLDILSGTFHPNANTEGAFTIQITDNE